ncbi:MAG TPA: hypothetical protein VNG95_06345 [Gemmatimonadales bacterium]|nr:hypothetical protein [Gemmatimonadales bacterium]
MNLTRSDLDAAVFILAGRFQRHRAAVDAWVHHSIPAWMKELLPPRVRVAA